MQSVSHTSLWDFVYMEVLRCKDVAQPGTHLKVSENASPDTLAWGTAFSELPTSVQTTEVK